MKLITLLFVLSAVFLGLPLLSGSAPLPHSLDAVELGKVLAKALAYWEMLFASIYSTK